MRMGLVDVARPDGGGQAVERAVAALDHLVDVLELQDAHHRPEDLVPGDRHLVLHVGEDGRLDEVALARRRGSPPVSSFAPSFLPALDVAQDLVELLLRHLRALLGRRGRTGRRPCGAFAFAASFSTNSSWTFSSHEQPAAGAAALALVEEQAEVRPFDGRVEVGVGEDDVRALAAQLEACTRFRFAAPRPS